MTRLDAWVDRWLLGGTRIEAPAVAPWVITDFEPRP